MASPGALRDALTLKKEEEGAAHAAAASSSGCARAPRPGAEALPSATLPLPAAALIHFMKSRAVKHCTAEQKAYAECVRGRTLSVVRALQRARARRAHAGAHQGCAADAPRRRRCTPAATARAP
jgi:hypothetical protein